MTLLENLKRWHDLGWTVLPCIVFWTPDKNGKSKRHKQPLPDWTEFQSRRPTDEEIEAWGSGPWKDYAGVCVVTGSGIVGVDFDQKDGKPDIEPWGVELLESGVTWTRTGGGGLHYYFRSSEPLRNATNIFGGDKEEGDTLVDIRGEGGIIVVGDTPVWSSDPRESKGKAVVASRYESYELVAPKELREIPATFRVRVQELPKRWLTVADSVVKEGNRHDTAKSVIAKLVNMVRTPDDLGVMKEAFRRIMQKHFENSLGNHEVEGMFDWAMEKERNKRGEGWYLFSGVLKEAVRKTKLEREYAEDMNDWGISVTKVERNDDRITFTFDDGKSCVVQTDDLFNQTKFRSAYVKGTNVVLPEIRKKSYLAFIQSVGIIEVEDVGGTFDDAIKETLEHRLRHTAASEDEASAEVTVLHRGFARYKNIIYFKLPSLMMEMKKGYPNLKRAVLTDTLRNADYEYIRKAHGRYWKYDFKELGDDAPPEAF